MSDKKSHPIRNGIIATVIGGIILTIILSFKNEFLKLLGWIWSAFVWVWNAIWASHSLPGWILIIIFFLAFIGAFVGIKKIYLAFRSSLKSDEEYISYTEDIFYGVKWRWSWIGNKMEISDILCFCLLCDAQLVPNYDPMEDKIDFYCEHCSNQVVATIKGGDIFNALGAAKREVLRRVRTGEFKKHIQTHDASE